MPDTSYRRWATPVIIIAVAVVLGVLVFAFRDRIATFVRFSVNKPSAASIVVISCLDEEQDGSCDGDLGRIRQQLLLRSLLERNVRRLRGSAPVAELLGTRVSRRAAWAAPEHLDVADGLLGHRRVTP